MSATTLANTTLLMAQVDHFMKIAAAKQAMGDIQSPAQNQNSLKDVSIFSLKKPE